MTRRSMSSGYSRECSRRKERRCRSSSGYRRHRSTSDQGHVTKRFVRHRSSSARTHESRSNHRSSGRTHESRSKQRSESPAPKSQERRRNSSRHHKKTGSSSRRNGDTKKPGSSSRRNGEDKSRKKRRRSSRRHVQDSGSLERVENKRRLRDREPSQEQETATVKNTKDGHLIFSKGDMMNSRYQIRRELGEGTFGKVVLCKDEQKSGERIAVKIIRNIEKYREAAKIEIEILKQIRDAGGCQGSVEMFGSFDFHGHTCIVFEVLGKSVFDFLKDNGFTAFPLSQIQRIADDMISALSFLHGLKYTHTDLKPENVLFINSEYESVYDKEAGITVRRIYNPAVKIIDLGSATHENEHHSRVVSTRHYRALEVIAETGWSYPCDIWSVGCILFELYTGHTMFQTHDNREHLGMMEHVLGTIPSSICRQSKKRYFKHGRVDFNKHGSSGRYVKKYCKKLLDYKQVRDDAVHDSFFDLLQGLLRYHPDDRLTASTSSKHEFFQKRMPDRDSSSYKSR